MTKVILSKNQARSIASFASLAGDKNQVRAIQGVNLVFKGKPDGYGTLEVSATNRYSVATQVIPVEVESDFSVIIGKEVIKYLKTAKGYVTLVVDGEMVTVSSIYSSTVTEQALVGKFPELESLFASVEATMQPLEKLTLDLAQIALVSKLIPVSEHAIGWSVYLQGEREGSRMPKAIYLERDGIKVLVQPMVTK